MAMLVPHPTRVLFFTGKGGVGKTSVACATAIGLADAGLRVLLVSTDPASNLDEVLGVTLTSTPTAISAVPGLAALNIDPEEAARAYRERVVGPYRGVLPAAAIASMDEQLSGACTVEIAAFDAFSRLLGGAEAGAFDHILFDTAPTGHTLRLLALPAAWSNFFDTNVGGTSCLGPLSGLSAQRALYAASNKALRDAVQTTLVLVARPDRASLAEAERTRAELAHLGIANVRFIVNGVFAARDTRDPIACALDARGHAALAAMPDGLRSLAGRTEVPLLPFGLVGVDALRALGAPSDHRLATSLSAVPPVAADRLDTADTLDSLIDAIAAHRTGVVMTMGKGGVGKTTVAVRVALALARRGLPVTLTTTDPAAHVAQTLGDLGLDREGTAWPVRAVAGLPAGLDREGLRVTRIDPAHEVRRYTDEVLAVAGAGLDAEGKALLLEELKSPCTEEIAVFHAFAATVAEGVGRFVVIDTAPTGHTLLLLDATEAYHREVAKRPSASPEAVRNLLPRLRDPDFTHILLVTLPEATPIHEAMALERDLARAAIKPFAWVVNQSLTPLAVTDPILAARRAHESSLLAALAQHATRLVVEPWTAEPIRNASVPNPAIPNPAIPNPAIPNAQTDDDVRAAVRAQYGAIARAATSASCAPGCCGPGASASLGLGYAPEDLAAVPEGANLGLGCGNPQAIASLVAGETVLDLGSGGGFDCFLAAKQVGPTGHVIGVDMTPDMVARARANARTLAAPNVQFRLGEIEHLPVADSTVDVILSNCVINLSPDKRAVFQDAFRVLRPGGRLAISDVVATRALPDALAADVAALTGCVAGAASVDILRALLDEAGFESVRVDVKEESRAFIRDWLPGSGVENFVASATIEAVKPAARRA